MKGVSAYRMRHTAAASDTAGRSDGPIAWRGVNRNA
jgi:hypothetical protein